MSTMSKEEWARRKGDGGGLGRTLRKLGNYLHISARAYMKQVKSDDGAVISQEPVIEKGTTYDKGRNKAKRLKR